MSLKDADESSGFGVQERIWRLQSFFCCVSRSCSSADDVAGRWDATKIVKTRAATRVRSGTALVEDLNLELNCPDLQLRRRFSLTVP